MFRDRGYRRVSRLSELLCGGSSLRCFGRVQASTNIGDNAVSAFSNIIIMSIERTPDAKGTRR